MATLALFAFFTVGGLIIGMEISRYLMRGDPTDPTDPRNISSVLKR